jgi:hypothetical protein
LSAAGIRSGTSSGQGWFEFGGWGQTDSFGLLLAGLERQRLCESHGNTLDTAVYTIDSADMA